ncbi:topoisomerase DNA-binding C4 zinc finger domain-containing protein [Tepidiforma sp.]|uniref:topoisomerase DNA-binding C4 zinc finger domain-containing protein n=1 Tax=Tepidiforma sp. TaxID=2682230 RepID=UPI0035B67618
MTPTCPLCGGSMVRRTARSGSNAGGQFWGCTRFPECRGTRPYVEASNGRTAQAPATSPGRAWGAGAPFSGAGRNRGGATESSRPDEPQEPAGRGAAV